MGRIADLLEKKALGSISETEQKELDSLLAESKLALTKDVEAEEAEGEDESVEEAAQKMADILQKSFANQDSKFEKVLEALAEKKEDKTVTDQPTFIVDKKLGKTHSVDELS
jgi:hypothetical protein